jgi:hypothetical protein
METMRCKLVAPALDSVAMLTSSGMRRILVGVANRPSSPNVMGMASIASSSSNGSTSDINNMQLCHEHYARREVIARPIPSPLFCLERPLFALARLGQLVLVLDNMPEAYGSCPKFVELFWLLWEQAVPGRAT